MTLLIKKDGPEAALLSITYLITPLMMKESTQNLVSSKSLLSDWFRAEAAADWGLDQESVSFQWDCFSE